MWDMWRATPDTTAFKCEVSVEESIEFARAIEKELRNKNE